MKTETYVYGVEPVNGYDAWALFEACALGDKPAAASLLANDPRLANAQYWYQFPIHLAVFAGQTEIVELLLAQGADAGQSRYTYHSWDKLLQCATERGYVQIAALLQDAMQDRFGFAPEFDQLKQAIIDRDPQQIDAVLREQPHLAQASDALGNNALHWSVITRQLGLLKRFVDSGTPIDAQRADGQTPVLLAANGATDYWHRGWRGRSHPSLRNNWILAGSLLALGAGYTFSVAIAAGDQERVAELLRQDPGLATRLDSARANPLTYAAREGYLHLVRLLLEHGANPNAPEESAPDGAALFQACCANHVEVAKLLLEHGANPNAGVDSSGCCLTICEVYLGDRAKPIQQLLRSYGATTPPYALNARQLKQALLEGHDVVRHEEFLDCVLGQRSRALLDLYLEADPSAVQHLSFDSILAFPRTSALVHDLLARGLDPNGTDWLGKTPLHACARAGARSAAALLLDAGADINARELEHQATALATAVREADPQNPEQSQRQLKMVELLLKRGAATSQPNDEPWSTPLTLASVRGQLALVELLRRHSAT